MRYLSTSTRLTLVTLQDRQGGANLFVVSPELAAMITWFLGSALARLMALTAYCLLRRLVRECQAFYTYLAAIPGRALSEVREAALDFLLGGLVYAT